MGICFMGVKMSKVLSGLEPSAVFGYFEEICNIPHCSGYTSELADYIVKFAEAHGLEFRMDDSGNIVIHAPASKGAENAPTVLLQTHLDMQCEKVDDSRHNFRKDPLELRFMDDEVFARGTTLGARNGFGIASCLAILDSSEIVHPPLEVVFTVDEREGMKGARILDMSDLKASYMIGFDGNDDGTILASSAGVLVGSMYVPVKYTTKSGLKYKIIVGGLHGGHAGTAIDSYQANANIIMGRLLHFLGDRVNYSMAFLSGGLAQNTIPREADCRVVIAKEDADKFENLISEFEKTIQHEYRANEHNLMIYSDFLEEAEDEPVLFKKTQERVIFLLNTIPDGVQKTSQEEDTKGIPETSINVALMRCGETEFFLQGSIRSSITSAKYALSEKLRYLTEMIGGRYEVTGDYPAWEYNEDSKLLSMMKEVYREEFGRAPFITGVHAGREGGIFSHNIKDLDVVSIGPDISNIHTPSEKLSISSTLRTWKFLLAVLGKIAALEQ
ncbi:dipeptidase D [Lachnospiraceae bacterium]|nr:dipeptidase D [Lachnospiraceae bacterium]